MTEKASEAEETSSVVEEMASVVEGMISEVEGIASEEEKTVFETAMTEFVEEEMTSEEEKTIGTVSEAEKKAILEREGKIGEIMLMIETFAKEEENRIL
mmetsp:Transcript_4039/g.4467  ORF Transcript_4039/g.4467 Transcript_4039/m.4467 type:complete len:99 (+) Transcript_4039:208-504(+)